MTQKSLIQAAKSDLQVIKFAYSLGRWRNPLHFIGGMIAYPFRKLADYTIGNYQKQLRDVRQLELENRLRYADTPDERLAVLKRLNSLNQNPKS